MFSRRLGEQDRKAGEIGVLNLLHERLDETGREPVSGKRHRADQEAASVVAGEGRVWLEQAVLGLGGSCEPNEGAASGKQPVQ